MFIVDISLIQQIVKSIGSDNFFRKIVLGLEKDFKNWNSFTKVPRSAMHVPNGVIELMPVCGDQYYSFKYVNGHVPNQQKGILTIVATGMLASVETGFPLLISEMTILTAFRTAATAVMASKYLARKNSSRLGIIGCGAQSEFQIMSHCLFFNIKEIFYFDINDEAMRKMAKNIMPLGIKMIPCANSRQVAENCDIIITVTAARGKNKILENSWIKKGTHINGIGGDCPNKTELDVDILRNSRVFVEFLEQTIYEGDIQNLEPEEIKQVVKGELWEVVAGLKNGRINDDDITVFDSVGFALEDYTILRLIYEIILNDQSLKKLVNLIPENLLNCTDLYSLIK